MNARPARRTDASLLIVDADDEVRGALASFARNEGVDVREAADLETALRTFAERRPSTIILDVAAEGTDGDRTFGRFRSDRRADGVPLIIHTARAGASLGACCTERVIPKPSSPQLVLESALDATRGPVSHADERLSVFVVDDDPDMRELLSEVLADEGIFAFSFGRAEDAVALLRGILPAAILTDLGLPGMGGRELARRVAAEGHGVPVIAITGHTDLGADRSLFAAVMLKPIEPFSLAGLIRRLAKERPAG